MLKLTIDVGYDGRVIYKTSHKERKVFPRYDSPAKS